MASEFKRLLVGRPLESSLQEHQRLPKILALAVFSSDALSSVAYATEAILVVLLTAGPDAMRNVVPIAIGIGLLLLIVGLSYRQTIYAYPNGGGAYVVAHENLGKGPGLIAAGSLLIDYVLTVAVSVSAGVAAITSLAINWGFPQLSSHRIDLALLFILIVTIINLRGLRESGTFFAIPTYVFVLSMVGLIGVGAFRMLTGNNVPAVVSPMEHEIPHVTATLGVFLLLQAFSAGCTAMTGVEAISNAVPAFQRPESRNAARTLMTMVGILGFLFLGLSVLANNYGVVPHENGETVVSQIARNVLGVGPGYFIIQIATTVILILAANTAFNGFPQLGSLLSRDRYLPRQFASRGDRLAYSNGIIVLALCASVLVIAFDAREQAMLPLYAIGVFISFTLSQTGMIRHWLTHRGDGWRGGIAINTVGAILTATVFIVIITTRFTHGGWMVIVALPVLVLMFRAIHNHYDDVAEKLSLQHGPIARPVLRHTVLVLVSGVHRGVIPALQYGKSLAPDNVTALYVDLNSEEAERIQAKWNKWGCDVPLVVLQSPYRSLVRPVLRYIDELDARYDDDVLSVIMPEFVPSKWWQHLLHNQTALILRTALVFRKRVAVITLPYHLGTVEHARERPHV
ncbi:MAG TPA: APC family permease [Roseiflexaceae bacterium]|nr:APC family permease [Roseiflexaceae bacterium]